LVQKRRSVARADNNGWSLYGAQRAQPVASGGKRNGFENASKQAKTVAVGCDRLPETFHGKEGVDGSSPSEGSARYLQIGRFPFSSTCRSSSLRWVWSRLWSFQIRNALPPPRASRDRRSGCTGSWSPSPLRWRRRGAHRAGGRRLRRDQDCTTGCSRSRNPPRSVSQTATAVKSVPRSWQIVVNAGDTGWSLYGAPWLQPVAAKLRPALVIYGHQHRPHVSAAGQPALVGLGSFRDGQSSAVVLDSDATGRLVRALRRDGRNSAPPLRRATARRTRPAA
jgi:hypothetical protein